jgi:hypothetical protein
MLLGTRTEPAKEGHQPQLSGANETVMVFPLAKRISADAPSAAEGYLANVPWPNPGVPRVNASVLSWPRTSGPDLQSAELDLVGGSKRCSVNGPRK